MQINKEWHLSHPMPKNPTLEQRVSWHIQHGKHCHCRQMPASIAAAIKKRNRKS